VKDLISYDVSRLILLNIGYNNIGNEGLKLLTSVRWPALKTLYVCRDRLTKVSTIFSKWSGLPPTSVSCVHFP